MLAFPARHHTLEQVDLSALDVQIGLKEVARRAGSSLDRTLQTGPAPLPSSAAAYS
jgi:hypothetical protein